MWGERRRKGRGHQPEADRVVDQREKDPILHGIRKGNRNGAEGRRKRASNIAASGEGKKKGVTSAEGGGGRPHEKEKGGTDEQP